MDNFEFEIQNIVGSGTLPVEIKTSALQGDLPRDSWMNDNEQPGLYWEPFEDGPQITFHESGSYIIRADDEDELFETNEYVIKELQKLGLFEDKDVDDIPFEIQNVVGLVMIGQDIRLRVLKMGLGKHAQYEPEVFPAVQYTRPRYPCTFLVYGNGKMISAGADSVESARGATEEFYEEVMEWVGEDAETL